MTSTETEDSEVDEFCEELLASCEKAFRDGVTSADIYDTLMEVSQKVMTAEQPVSSWEVCIRATRVMRRVFWVSFSVLVAVISIYWGLVNLNLRVWPLPLFDDSRCLLPSHPLVMELTRPISNCSICQNLKNGTPVVEFKSKPTSAAFEAVAYSSRPIIIRGGATATGMSTTFNFKNLKTLFGSVPGAMESVIEECQFLPFRSSFSNLNEVFDTVSDAIHYETPWYIGWSNCHPEIIEKLRELFPRPNFLPKDSESSVIDWIFIGSPGYGAAMHLDYVRRPSWQAQLSGRKHWTLKPPPECESLCTDGISFSINSGDLIFLDTNSWYHETFIEGTELSISIGSEYD